jgi:hypothetical protein
MHPVDRKCFISIFLIKDILLSRTPLILAECTMDDLQLPGKLTKIMIDKAKKSEKCFLS